MRSVPGKVYGRVIRERLKEITGHKLGEGQDCFKGRWCIDQTFTIKLLSEKHIEKKKLHASFVD